MKLYIVRHGQSTHNANQDVPHNPDPPLTDLGQEQARRTAAALKEADIGAAAHYASPQRRALQTAAALHSALGLAPHVIPDICEVGGVGEHPGMCRAEIFDEWPGVTCDPRITDRGWWSGGTREDDESVFYRRADAAIALLRERHRDTDDTVVIVTHGRFGSALVSAVLGLGPGGYRRIPFDNCGISRVDFDPHDRVAYAPPPVAPPPGESAVAVQLIFHNRTEHLPTSMRT